MTLRYRDSVSSTASSLSRNSTISSTDTRYFSAIATPKVNSPPLSRAPTSHIHPTIIPQYSNTYNTTSPTQLSPISMPSPEMYQQPYHSFSQPIITQTNTIDPNGCFVPCKPLPLLQKNETTRHHYVVPTFAMVISENFV